MHILFLILAISGIVAQNTTRKSYGKITSSGMFLFFLVASGFKLSFTSALIPYVILFALGYGSAVLFSLLAIKCGPLAITALISSFSLIVPTVYGIAVFGETVKTWFYVGCALLVACLVLVNLKRGEGGVTITLKWVIFVVLSFVGNGLCSTVQAVQQKDFPDQYKSEFMIASLLMVSVVFIAFAIFRERDNVGQTLKKGGILMVICGLANGMSNQCVMKLVGLMDTSLMYPLISAGSIILTSVISRVAYGERLSRSQQIGLALGVASVVFMNL